MTDYWLDADGTERLRGTFVGGGSQPGVLTAAEVTFQETPGAGDYAAAVDLPAGSVLVGVTLHVTADWEDPAADVPFSVGDESSPTNIIDGTGGNIGFVGDGVKVWYTEAGAWSGNAFAGFGVAYPTGQTITVSVTTSGGTGATTGYIFYLAPATPVAAVKS